MTATRSAVCTGNVARTGNACVKKEFWELNVTNAKRIITTFRADASVTFQHETFCWNKVFKRISVTECPACYGLVQDAVGTQRQELERLERLTDAIGNQPVSGGDDFEDRLDILNSTLNRLLNQAISNDGILKRV